jgi:hypothetical protein
MDILSIDRWANGQMGSWTNGQDIYRDGYNERSAYGQIRRLADRQLDKLTQELNRLTDKQLYKRTEELDRWTDG